MRYHFWSCTWSPAPNIQLSCFSTQTCRFFQLASYCTTRDWTIWILHAHWVESLWSAPRSKTWHTRSRLRSLYKLDSRSPNWWSMAAVGHSAQEVAVHAVPSADIGQHGGKCCSIPEDAAPHGAALACQWGEHLACQLGLAGGWAILSGTICISVKWQQHCNVMRALSMRATVGGCRRNHLLQDGSGLPAVPRHWPMALPLWQEAGQNASTPA